MSASPIARQATQSQAIPARRVVINDPSQLPHDYSTTPGGTLFSTTPGGTRIVYERAFLLQMRNSPSAQTPPKNLPNIPGVTCTKVEGSKPKENGEATCPVSKGMGLDEGQEQFEMDI